MALEFSTKNCQKLEVIGVKLPLHLELSIKRLSRREGFTTCNVKTRCASAQVSNFLSILYGIDIKGRTNDGDKELHLFVKHVVEGATLKIFSMSNIYETEFYVYKELSEIFAQLQDEANIPVEERYKIIHAYEESNAQAIIIDDIAKNGFNTNYRMEVASLNFFETAVRQLAKFHGLSFVLRELRPEYFKKNIKSLKCPYIFEEGWTDMATNLRTATVDILDVEFKDKHETAYDMLIYKFKQFYTEHDELPVCLCHGDYRPCNIMIKTEEGEIADVLVIDYQLAHYSNPVFDFLYLIYCGTDRAFRKNNLLNLKEQYYETLTDFLKYFNLNVDTVYPKAEFEKVYKEKLDFGLLISLFTLPLIFAPDDDVPDFSNGKIPTHFNQKFKQRFQDVLTDFAEWGFL